MVRSLTEPPAEVGGVKRFELVEAGELPSEVGSAVAEGGGAVLPSSVG